MSPTDIPESKVWDAWTLFSHDKPLMVALCKLTEEEDRISEEFDEWDQQIVQENKARNIPEELSEEKRSSFVLVRTCTSTDQYSFMRKSDEEVKEDSDDSNDAQTHEEEQLNLPTQMSMKHLPSLKAIPSVTSPDKS